MLGEQYALAKSLAPRSVNLNVVAVVIAVVQLADTGHSCNFENGLCSGWRQLYDDDFDWTRRSGSTPSSQTGPSSGNGGYGYYMYIETSPRARGDKAKLEYTVPSSDVGKLFCMTLYYHMYGSTINQLNIYNGQGNRVFSKSGQQGNKWLKAKTSITLQSKVIFEGIRGASYTGDIAIDDVSFTDGICKDCALMVNQTFGEIDFKTTSNYYTRCSWTIHNAAVMQAVALVSVQELNLAYCSEYAKITDGFGKEVLYHQGCEPFATENLLDVALGHSNNISIQTYLGRSGSSIKIKFAIFKGGISSAIMAFGWNVTVLNPFGTGFTLQWTQLPANINRVARFYIILVKSIQGSILNVETVPESISILTINGRRPSTKYRVVVYGVDDAGELYKSEERFASTTEIRCGSRQGSSRIVGGSVARINSWPWQVMMLYSNGRQFCGGTLIDRYWVATAAHCVSGKSPSSIKMKLGAHYRTSGSVGTEQEIYVHRIIPHPNYNSTSNSHDIALIRLSTPANLGVGIGLACMPDFSHSLPFDKLQKKCWITGWGTLYSGGYQPNTLMEARIPLVSKERCDVSHPGKIDNTMLCAGFDSGGVDTCQGDSGGPLVCEFNNTWYLEGVTSWGYGCAYARKYGVYAYVRHFKGWLLQNMDQVIPDPTVLPHHQSINALVWCHFDHGLCSGWNQSTSEDFDWTLYHGSTPSSSTGPTAGQGGSGYYMFIEASSPRKTGDKAKLVASVPSNGKKACLSFYYHLYGVGAGTLNVYSGSNKVFNISGNQGKYWIMVERNIRLDGSVTFEGIVGSSYTGDIAIDSVNITNGSCPVFCNFDNGLCFGWTQSKSDVFDWTLRSGSTPSWSTGPSAGHGGSGKYMYIEALSWSRGSNAKLEMAVPRNKISCCLVFYYHMYGAAMGTLNVFNGNKNIFTKSGNQGNYWKRVSRTVYFTDLVTFEGIRGSSSTSDIAIDDVSIRDGSCPGCGGVLNKSSGQLSKQNGGDEGELRCNWTIGHAGVSQAFAIFTLERVYMRYCNEYLKILNMNGNEVFTQAGCGASLPYGTVLEVPFGGGSHLSLNLLLEYRWSAVTINYIIQRNSFDSAELLSSWNISVSRIAVSSASIYWPSFPLSAVVTHYLIRYKEASNGVSRLFRANNYNNWHNANRLRGFTNYTVQVLAVTRSNGNVTYASNPVYFQTLEGAAPTSGSSTRTTAESQTTTDPPTTSESSTSAVQTPSLEQKGKSAVLLRVSGLDIKKWDQKMKDAFKTQVASAATKHCAVDVAQCQVAQTRSRRRRSSGMTFTPDMVHILPGYPKESLDDPEITLLAFYLSLPQGVSGGTVVNKDVLQDIVKSDMSGIGQSMDSTIDSVAPVETTSEKIQHDNEDGKEDKESKPTSVIIGASVGGVVFIALVAVFIMVAFCNQTVGLSCD